ncbi:MAG: zinc-finger domain-containing protein [Comamonas sp.]
MELTARDVHDHGGVFCPSPKAGMKIWNNHPRVFIEIAHLGEGKCPYCGTRYRLKAGEKLKGGH